MVDQPRVYVHTAEGVVAGIFPFEYFRLMRLDKQICSIYTRDVF